MVDLLHFLVFESPTTRKIIYSFTGQVLILWICEKALWRRRSLVPIAICLAIKALTFYPMDYYLLLHPGMGADVVYNLRIFTFVWNCITFGLMLWTYEGNYGKTWVTLFAAEVIYTVLSFPILMGVGFMEGRSDLKKLGGPLLPGDFLIPVLTWVVWRVTRKYIEMLGERLRRWTPKYPGIVWFITFAIFFSNNILTKGTEFAESNNENHISVYQFWGMLLVGLLMIWLWYRQRRENQRRSDLEQQLRFCETYDTILTKNAAIQKSLREDILQQVADVEKQLAQGDADNTFREQPQIRQFLTQLSQDTQQLKPEGLFSGNMMIDSVLYKWRNAIEEKGGEVDYQCADLSDMGKEPLLFLPQILELICEEWFDQHFSPSGGTKRFKEAKVTVFRLKMTVMKEQILISTDLPEKWDRKRKRQFTDRVRKIGGVVTERTGYVFCSCPVT